MARTALRGMLRAAAAAALVAGLAVGPLAVVAHAQEATTTSANISKTAKECIELLQKGGKEAKDCHEAPSPILPELSELLWSIVSFTVLLLLMYKFAWPGIKKAMAARSEKIRDNLESAERVKNEADSVLQEYQRQLADARNEANRIIEEARQTADQLRRDLMSRAESEVADLRQRARDDISAAQERATADLRTKVGALAIELAEKVVEANLDRDANMRLIESYIQSVGSGNGA